MSSHATNIHSDKILILDFGSQYTQLIARRIREIGVYCEIYSCDCNAEEVKNFAPKGIILSGGPETVTSSDTPRAPQIVFELGVPVLGICYGMQPWPSSWAAEWNRPITANSVTRRYALAAIPNCY